MKHLSIPLLLLLMLPVLNPSVWAATPAKPAALVPTDPVLALLEQSRDAKSRGEVELALRLAQAAIVADPTRTNSYVALGDLYAAQGQNEFARSYYDAALEIDPADPAALKAVAAQGNSKATAVNAP